MRDPNAVLMVGWEYPPHNSGGLGVACQGLTEALATAGQEIYFTLPYSHPVSLSHMQVLGCADPYWGTTTEQPPFNPYVSTTTPAFTPAETDQHQLRSLPQSLMEQRVNQYADHVASVGQQVDDLVSGVHAHDWMSFPAAMKVQEKTGKPFIAHVHSTEWDRIPTGNGSSFIHDVEYEGLSKADQVIAVSAYTKSVLVHKYNVDPNKISVVYNGIDPLSADQVTRQNWAKDRPVIVFMGRLTMQKGAEYFLQVARQVLQELPDALFIMAGNGDMYKQLLFTTAYDKLSARVLFTGFVRGQAKAQLLDRADVFIMSSVSEPFGIVALEAAQRNTPVIVSHNSGVKEVMPAAIVADHWDVQKMTKEVVRLAKNQKDRHEIVSGQHHNLKDVTWKKAALDVKQVYRSVFVGR